MHGSSQNAVETLRESGYTSALLDGLAVHASRILGVTRTCIFLRDEEDPGSAFVVAGHGLIGEEVGDHVPLSDDFVGHVLRTGDPKLLGDGVRVAGDSGGAAPICWEGRVRGAVAAICTEPARLFVPRDLEILCQLAELAGHALQHAERRERLETTVQAGVEALTAAIDMRDGYTGQHSEDVVELASRVGMELEFDPDSLIDLSCAARLHDVGKIAVPDEILQKPGPLEENEWEVIRSHPVRGAEVLARIPGLEVAATIVRFHHECWDGSGYPEGLAGQDIPLASRVIAACDAFRAMTSHRPYRRALTPDRAVRELEAGAGSQFDPRIVETVLQLV